MIEFLVGISCGILGEIGPRHSNLKDFTIVSYKFYSF